MTAAAGLVGGRLRGCSERETDLERPGAASESPVVDEARRQLIAARTREAIAERKRAGTYRGPQPFVDESTVNVILGLARRGWSLREIAQLLDLEGRPTARGGPWGHSSVRKILVREGGRRSASADSAMTPLYDRDLIQ
jgi:hypothetical protein